MRARGGAREACIPSLCISAVCWLTGGVLQGKGAVAVQPAHQALSKGGPVKVLDGQGVHLGLKPYTVQHTQTAMQPGAAPQGLGGGLALPPHACCGVAPTPLSKGPSSTAGTVPSMGTHEAEGAWGHEWGHKHAIGAAGGST